jgi:hypothetical protein
MTSAGSHAADHPAPLPHGTGVALTRTMSHARASVFPMRGSSSRQPAVHDPPGLQADPPLNLSPWRSTAGPASHRNEPEPSHVGARTGECSGRASPHEPGIRGPTAVASCPLQGTCPGAWHARLRCPPAQAWGQRTSVGREMESFSPLPPRVWVRGRGEKLVLLRRRCLDLMAEDLAMIDGGWERGGDDGITRGEQSPARCCEPPHRGSYRFGPRET